MGGFPNESTRWNQILERPEKHCPSAQSGKKGFVLNFSLIFIQPEACFLPRTYLQ